ncbi:MAG: FG-GAP repeat domain-containing protein [Caldilineaceae bacterium]
MSVCLVCLLGASRQTLYATALPSPSAEANNFATIVLDQTPAWFSAATNLNVRSLAWGDMDGDGDLDLAVGNYGQPNLVYLNNNGKLQDTPAWTSTEADNTTSIAWGDMNGDGKLDLAVGNEGQPNRIYKNVGTTLEATATFWNASVAMSTRSIALGDANGDGRYDLAVGNYDQINQIYFNSANGLPNVSNWNSLDVSNTTSVIWCDFNRDNRLDLAVGNRGQSVHIHLNTSTGLPTNLGWSASDGGQIESVACADIDKNGYLDLLAGNVAAGQSSRVYYNQNGVLPSTATADFSNNATTLALGDADNDGDLDLAAAVENRATVYRNRYEFASGIELSGLGIDGSTNSVVWADVDGDNDLDLAAGGVGSVRVYYNHSVTPEPKYQFTEETNLIGQTAWGDMDSDGDLDLAAAVGLKTKVYRNDGRRLNPAAVWVSLDNEGSTNGQAWGDVDGDGDLDLATAGYGPTPRTRIYYNTGQMLQITTTWRSAVSEYSNSIAWGDVDGDGDLDLASGNLNRPNTLYINDNGVLRNTPSWYSNDNDNTNSIAWGDMDGDGDLDLAVSNRNPNGWTGASEKVYLNVGGTLQTTPVWISPNDDHTVDIAWGDVDGDGDLDLATANDKSPTKIYLNQTGILQTTPDWLSSDIEETSEIAWGDFDNDGDLDLFASPFARLYLNENGQLRTSSIRFSPSTTGGDYHLSVGDMDSDGDLDLVSGPYLYTNHKSTHSPTAQPSAAAIHLLSSPVTTFSGYPFSFLAPTNFYGVPVTRQSPIIPITYDLFHPTSEPVGAIRAYYSLDGALGSDRTRWRIARPAAGTQITDLTTSPYPTKTVASQHLFQWDVQGSGFFGQSDNVVLRIEALPGVKPTVNGVPGPYQRPYVAAQTFPFRVRGSQIRVVRAGNPPQPVNGAIVYRLPANQVANGLPFRNHNGSEFRTAQNGYLQGRGALEVGDRLVALVPISATTLYTLYHTSATPTADGLNALVVNTSGAQTLTVAATNPLLLFNPVISLEWDARNDPTFLTQLQNDIRRTSQILYDVTNGQAALGRVRIYHDKGFWGTANVVITANNDQRPNAILGGSVTTPVNDVDLNNTLIQDAYVPGQVRIGATWNRFGDPDGIIGEDWPSVLAHELGHYFFFVADNYIGVTADRRTLKIVDCPGSLMTDPYDDRYSEFAGATTWTGQCLETVAARYLGRADWQTITKFYPMLSGAANNAGPNQLPLAVTQIDILAPPTPTKTLADPFFSLLDSANKTITIPNGRGQAYLLKTQGNSDPTDDYVIALGTPIGDQVRARGASPGDRLCVFDYSRTPLRLGCLNAIGNTPTPVQLFNVTNWQPQIRVTGLSTNTVAITVTNVPTTSPLSVQLLPALGVASNEVAMTRRGNSFVQQVTAPDGAYFGYIRIWVPNSNPRREMIVEYAAIEAWNGRARAWGTPGDAWGGRARAWGVNAYAWGGRARAWGAPVMSSDGQVSIFPLDNPFAGGARFALQTVTFPPTLPRWLHAVGQAYRVTSDGVLPPSSILFSYLARSVPAGYEEQLTIYFSANEGRTWQRLVTTLDTRRNQASATIVNKGIYVLVATVPVRPTFAVGWNNFGYTIQASQTITEGLASIQGKYSAVYSYNPALSRPWLFYDPAVQPPFDGMVNTLRRLDYGKGYWIYATQAVVLYLGIGSASVEETADENDLTSAPLAPATYYGWITPSASFTPTIGMTVTALIDNVVCGETSITTIEGQLAYALAVAADDAGDESGGCGVSGKNVIFKVGDTMLPQGVAWNNAQANFWPLTDMIPDGIERPNRIYLPLANR